MNRRAFLLAAPLALLPVNPQVPGLFVQKPMALGPSTLLDEALERVATRAREESLLHLREIRALVKRGIGATS